MWAGTLIALINVDWHLTRVALIKEWSVWGSGIFWMCSNFKKANRSNMENVFMLQNVRSSPRQPFVGITRVFRLRRYRPICLRLRSKSMTRRAHHTRGCLSRRLPRLRNSRRRLRRPQFRTCSTMHTYSSYSLLLSRVFFSSSTVSSTYSPILIESS